MQITAEKIDYAATKAIAEITGENIYEYCGCTENEKYMRIATLGEISGVLKLADRLKEVLNT